MSRRVAVRASQAALSVGLLAYVVATVPMHEAAEALLSALPAWAFGGLAAVLAAQLINALQMRSILASQGMAFSVWQVVGINVISTFYGLLFPGSLAGGVIRWHHFSMPEGKRAQAFASIVFSRGVEIVTMLGFGIVFWYLSDTDRSSASVIATLLFALAAIVSIIMFLASQAQQRMLGAALSRIPMARRLRDAILEVSASLAEFGRHGNRHLLQFLSLCIVRNAFAVTAFVSFARALGIDVPFADLGWVRSAIDLLLILPISIAGLGVRDASLVALMTPLGVMSSTAIAFSFLLLGVTLLNAMIGGLVEALRVYYGVAPGLIGRATEASTRASLHDG